MNVRLKTWVAATLGAAMALAANAEEPALYSFNLPEQLLTDSLRAIAQQTGSNVLFQSRDLYGIKAPELKGQLTASEALERLLAGTRLHGRQATPTTVIVQPIADNASSLDSWKLAQANGRESQNEDRKAVLEEVIVTAQKREERLQDVPIPVTALNADTLAEEGKARLQDYYNSIPGLTYIAGINAGASLQIRGIGGTGGTGPTVGVTIDDVPLSGIASVIGGALPDIDPSDLARIETLRGPQGTLYGVSSMGGLLKYVTVDPSTETFSGRVQADANSVSHGDKAGYGFRGAINVPIADTVALRASAFTRRDPGYIDNPFQGTKDVNTARESGGRVSALWKPSDALSLKLSALYEYTKADSNNDVQPALGDLKQNFMAGCCFYTKELQLYTANLNAKLGIVDLTSVTGYSFTRTATSFDYSPYFGGVDGFVDSLTPLVPGPYGAGDLGHAHTDRFTQEIRASLPIGQKLDLLMGGFYEHEHAPWYGYGPTVDPLTGNVQPPGTFFFVSLPNKYSEYAAFADLTIHFTDRFDVQFGGREAHTEITAEPGVESGALFGGTINLPANSSTANVFTYLITPQFKFSPNLMAYVRVASGYRPGGYNGANSDPAVPRSVKPDKTENFDMGVKGNFLDNSLSFDASIYYIDWKDIPLDLFDTTINPDTGQPYAVTYTTSASRAKSQGLELSVEARPLQGLTVSAWVSYNDAVLTKDFPASSTAYGPEGSRLPLSARLSGNLGFNQSFPLIGGATGYAGAQLSYIGDRLGNFSTRKELDPTSERATYPSYAKLDLKAGVKYESWTVNLYANNLTDKRGLIGGGIGNQGENPPDTLRYITPRTIGVSAVKTF